MIRLRCTRALWHRGFAYAVGAELHVDEDTANALLAAGRVELRDARDEAKLAAFAKAELARALAAARRRFA